MTPERHQRCSGVFIVWTDFIHRSGVPIVDFQHVNAGQDKSIREGQGYLLNKCSELCIIHKIIPAMESLFRLATLIKTALHHKCFPVIFLEKLDTPLLLIKLNYLKAAEPVREDSLLLGKAFY